MSARDDLLEGQLESLCCPSCGAWPGQHKPGCAERPEPTSMRDVLRTADQPRLCKHYCNALRLEGHHGPRCPHCEHCEWLMMLWSRALVRVL